MDQQNQKNNYDVEDDWSDEDWDNHTPTNSNSIKGMELRSLIPKNQPSKISKPKSSSYSGYIVKEGNMMDR